MGLCRLFVLIILITLITPITFASAQTPPSQTTPQPIVDTKFIVSLSICGVFFCMISVYALYTYRLRFMKRRAREAKQKEKTIYDKPPEIL